MFDDILNNSIKFNKKLMKNLGNFEAKKKYFVWLKETTKDMINNASWSLNDTELAKLTITSWITAIKETINISFNFREGDIDRTTSTLSECFEDRESIENIKENTMGSSIVAYFMKDSHTISKSRKVLDQIEFGSDPSFDKDLLVLLKNTILPVELRLLELKPNKTVFVNPSRPLISACPDGTCLINGIVCPVELLTKKIASDIFSNIKQCESDSSKFNDYSSFISDLKCELVSSKDRIDTQILWNATHQSETLETHVKRNKVNVRKRTPKLKDGDGDFNTNDRRRLWKSNQTKDYSSRLLFKQPYKEKRSQSFDKRSISQKKRQFISHISFSKDDETTPIPYAKKQQLIVHMSAMQVTSGLLLIWKGDVVVYSIVEMQLNSYSSLDRAWLNFKKWKESCVFDV